MMKVTMNALFKHNKRHGRKTFVRSAFPVSYHGYRIGDRTVFEIVAAGRQYVYVDAGDLGSVAVPNSYADEEIDERTYVTELAAHTLGVKP